MPRSRAARDPAPETRGNTGPPSQSRAMPSRLRRLSIGAGHGTSRGAMSANLGLVLKSIQGWLGITEQAPEPPAPLANLLNALDHLEPSRAQYLARFAYL